MSTSGTYQTRDGAPVVRFERTLPDPPARVWKAITDPAQLEAWFPTTVQYDVLELGAPLEFHFAEDRYPPMRGEILGLEPERRLVFTWGEDRLTFELDREPDGCRLSLTVELDSADKAARDSAGWEHSLDRLAAVAGGGQLPTAPEAAWRGYYDAYVAQGFPAAAPILQ